MARGQPRGPRPYRALRGQTKRPRGRRERLRRVEEPRSMRVAPRTEVRVIPDLLHGRDEHLTRDTEFPAVRGYEESGPRGGDCGLLQTGHWREARRCCWPRLTPAFVLARVFHAMAPAWLPVSGSSSRRRRRPTQNRGCFARKAAASDLDGRRAAPLPATAGPSGGRGRVPRTRPQRASGDRSLRRSPATWLRAFRTSVGVRDLLADFDPGVASRGARAAVVAARSWVIPGSLHSSSLRSAGHFADAAAVVVGRAVRCVQSSAKASCRRWNAWLLR